MKYDCTIIHSPTITFNVWIYEMEFLRRTCGHVYPSKKMMAFILTIPN